MRKRGCLTRPGGCVRPESLGGCCPLSLLCGLILPGIRVCGLAEGVYTGCWQAVVSDPFFLPPLGKFSSF